MKNATKSPAKATTRKANAKANAKAKKEVKLLTYECPTSKRKVKLGKGQSRIYATILELERKETLTAHDVARLMNARDKFEDKGLNRVYKAVSEGFARLTTEQKKAIRGKATMPNKKDFFDKITAKYPSNVFYSKFQGFCVLKEFNEKLKLKNKVAKQNKATAEK
jgi:hypothetical protein